MRLRSSLLLLLILVSLPSVVHAVGPAIARYEVERTDGAIEIRRYPEVAYAFVTVNNAPDETAIKQGFDRLLAYLDTGNRASVKIPLTLPLLQTAVTENGISGWQARCILPSQNATPASNDPDIRTEIVPATRWAVVRFSGSLTADNLRDHEEKLRRWVMSTAKVAFTDQPRYAFYDPPWMPPFLRRNEIMFSLID